MLQVLKLYAVATVTFFVVDLVWIGVVAAGFYERQLGHLLSGSVRWEAAILFYLIFIAGVLVYAVLPALESESLVRAALLGGFLGLFAYATFDLTCMALFKDFPGVVVVVDMIWGALLSSTVSTVTVAVGLRFLGG
ncbi:MAG: DUF2177 family protein [Gemmatimonadota bacterium]|jgi:uncharacterized membrane protein